MGPKSRNILCFIFIPFLLLLLLGCDPDPVTYSLEIIIEPEAGGTVEPDTGDFPAGTSLVLKVTAAENFEFLEWDGPHGAQVTEDEGEWKILMDGDKEITAVFIDVSLEELDKVERPYWDRDKIKWQDVSNASEYEVILFKDGDSIIAVSVVSGVEEYDFSDYMVQEGSGSYTVTVQALGDNIDYLDGPPSDPSDTRIKYTLIMEIGEGKGLLTPEEGSHLYTSGDSITLVATADAGLKWVFNKWEGPVQDSTENITEVIINEDTTVRAFFSGGFYGGSGTPEDPFWVNSSRELDLIRDHLNKSFILKNDIDLEDFFGGAGWVPLGGEKEPFMGTLDGDGNKIVNLRINRANEDYIGLFAATHNDAIIKNMEIEDFDIRGKVRVGGLVGVNCGKIENVIVSGQLRGDHRIGGLVGQNEGLIEFCQANVEVRGRIGTHLQIRYRRIGGLVGTSEGSIKDSVALGNVWGDFLVGGITGENEGTIIRCYAAGNIEGEERTGGLCGHNQGTIEQSFANGDVDWGKIRDKAGQYFGGLVGLNGSFLGSDPDSGTVSDSYATGDIEARIYVGGFVGRNNGSLYNSYAAGNVFFQQAPAGMLVGFGNDHIDYCYYDSSKTGNVNIWGEGKTTAAMMKGSTFQPEWDFSSIWTIKEDESYPYLRWQDDENIPYP